MGRRPDAIEALEKAVALKPTADTYSNLGTLYFFEKRYPEAVQTYEKAVEMGGHVAVTWGNLGDAYRYVPGLKEKAAGAYEKAIELTRIALGRNPRDGELHQTLARYLALVGRREEALDESQKAAEMAPENPYVIELDVQIHEVLDMRAEAFKALEKIARTGGSLEMIEDNPDLAGLRSDPRYAKLLKVAAAASEALKKRPGA